uniref:nuclease-related domain-containing protein n=1 Tax=Amycolatopsis sp. CA-151526 TaxID=3239921 RepID=UPI003F4978A1
MLVRVHRGGGAGRGLSGAEEQLVRRLESWRTRQDGDFHLPGLALVNVNVPDRHSVRQADALVFTPSGLIVIEVKGLRSAQAGTLVVPANGPWLVDGQPLDVHTLAGLNPGEQVKAAVYATKNAFEQIDGGGNTFVSGLVVLMTRGPGLRIRNTGCAGRGIHVVSGSQTALRRAVHTQLRKPKCWSADGVLQACRVLGLAGMAPTRSELLTEGFPDLILAAPARPHPARPPQPRPASPAPAPAAWPRPAGGPSRRATGPRPSVPAQGPAPQTPDRPRPPRPPDTRAARSRTAAADEVLPRAIRPGRHWPWGLIIVLILLTAAAVTVAIVLHQAFHSN